MIQIDNMIISAMKEQDRIKLRTYRNIKAEIMAYKTSKGAKTYDDAIEISILTKYSKKLEDSILEFSKAGREDLVSEYRDELEILQKLIPEPPTLAEIESFICDWCVENQFVKLDKINQEDCNIPKKEMGNAIKAVKAKFPAADGKIISQLIKSFVK